MCVCVCVCINTGGDVKELGMQVNETALCMYEWVMSHIWMSHVTHMNESCHTYEWVMSHIWMSHVTHRNESSHTYEWVMSHICISHVTHMNESCHTYECVKSHVWMSQVTHMNESCHTYEWVMLHIWMSHVTHTNKSCHKHEWAMTTFHFLTGIASVIFGKIIAYMVNFHIWRDNHICDRICGPWLTCWEILSYNHPSLKSEVKSEYVNIFRKWFCNGCNAATHFSTLQHTATHYHTLPHTLRHAATHCNTLQHTATHCNTVIMQYGFCGVLCVVTCPRDRDYVMDCVASCVWLCDAICCMLSVWWNLLVLVCVVV